MTRFETFLIDKGIREEFLKELREGNMGYFHMNDDEIIQEFSEGGRPFQRAFIWDLSEKGRIFWKSTQEEYINYKTEL